MWRRVASEPTSSLREYFERQYKQGGCFNPEEYEDHEGDWCWQHRGTSIKVWKDAIDLTQGMGEGSIGCYFHYTSELRGFKTLKITIDDI